MKRLVERNIWVDKIPLRVHWLGIPKSCEQTSSERQLRKEMILLKIPRFRQQPTTNNKVVTTRVAKFSAEFRSPFAGHFRRVNGRRPVLISFDNVVCMGHGRRRRVPAARANSSSFDCWTFGRGEWVARVRPLCINAAKFADLTDHSPSLCRRIN